MVTDLLTKPLIRKTGPKHTIRTKELKNQQRNVPQINSFGDLKISQKKKSTEELKDKVQGISQNVGQKIMKI